MMKKVLLVVLCLMIASASFAQSAPSNLVGYTKHTAVGAVGVTAYTSFGLAFKHWDVVGGVPTYGVESNLPSDIIGDQAAPGGAITADLIMRQDNGWQAYRDAGAGNAWTDQLEDSAGMIPGPPYWYANKTGADRVLVLAGEVDNTGNYGSVTLLDPPDLFTFSSTAYAWRDSRNVALADLGLGETGPGDFTGGDAVTSDKIINQTNGSTVNYIDTTGYEAWEGGFTTITPAQSYWIVNKHPGNIWVYTYVGVAAAASTGSNDARAVSSMKTPVTVKTSERAVSRTTSKTVKTERKTDVKKDSPNAKTSRSNK